jgi:hypothetical protein
VIIPKSRYEAFAQRLRLHGHKWSKYTFLAYRCDRAFLATYVETDDAVVQDACHSETYTYRTISLDMNPAAQVLVRLNECGLLPSAYRQEFLEEVRRRAVEAPDSSFITSPAIRSALSDDEIAGILAAVMDECIPALGDIVDAWTTDYSGGWIPEVHFQPLLSTLDIYKEALAGNATAQNAIGKAVEAIEEAISDLSHDEEAAAEAAAEYAREHGGKLPSEERSIFDDIDDEP